MQYDITSILGMHISWIKPSYSLLLTFIIPLNSSMPTPIDVLATFACAGADIPVAVPSKSAAAAAFKVFFLTKYIENIHLRI